MTLSNERGSALIITLMLLLILTAIGIYAISISTTEMSIALQSKTGTATLNTTESGAHFAIDQIPNLVTNERCDAGRPIELQREFLGDRRHDAQARFRRELPLCGLHGGQYREPTLAVRRAAEGAGRGHLRAGSRGDDVLTGRSYFSRRQVDSIGRMKHMNTRKIFGRTGPAAFVPDRAAAGRLCRRHGALHDLGQSERAADARHHGIDVPTAQAEHRSGISTGTARVIPRWTSSGRSSTRCSTQTSANPATSPTTR